MEYFEITKEGKLKNKQDKEFLPGISELYLWCWHLTDISNVNFPPKLKYLNLGNNKLTNISNVIFPPRLNVLKLHNNNLKNISNAIFPSELKRLDLSNNPFLSDISNTIFPPKLKELNLNCNYLTDISNVTFPPELQILHLNFNKLTDISNIIFPKKLKNIHLTYNYNLSGILGIFPGWNIEYIYVCKKIRIVQRQIRKWYFRRKIKENKISLFAFKIAYDMDYKHSFMVKKLMKSFMFLSEQNESKFE